MFAFVFLFANSGFRILTKNWLEFRKLKANEAKLKLELNQKMNDLNKIRENPKALERQARHELDFIKKGEIEYRFTPPAHSN